MVNFFAALRLCPKGVKDVHDMLVRIPPTCGAGIDLPAECHVKVSLVSNLC